MIGTVFKYRRMGWSWRESLRAGPRAAFAKVPGLTLLDYPADRVSSCWFFTVLVPQRENFVRALQSRGVPSSVVHQRIDRNAIFGGPDRDLVNQNHFDEHQIALPVHVGLTDADMEQVITAVQVGW